MPEVTILQFIRMEEPGLSVELFLVERQEVYYTLRYAKMGSLSFGIEASAKNKGRAKQDFDRLVAKNLKGVTLMGGRESGEATVTATEPDQEARKHLQIFSHSLYGVGWEQDKDAKELPSPQEDFLPYLQQQLRHWKGSPVSLSVTQHEYWDEFHKMVVQAVAKQYGQSIKGFRGIHGKQATSVIQDPGKPLALNLFSSWADSLNGARQYRGHKGDQWIVVQAVFKPRDIALAPVTLPDFIEPDILMDLARDVYHTGDEFIVGPLRAISNYKVVAKTRQMMAAAVVARYLRNA